MADLFQRFESYDGSAVGGASSSISSTNPFDILEPSSAITESVVRSVSWLGGERESVFVCLNRNTSVFLARRSKMNNDSFCM